MNAPPQIRILVFDQAYHDPAGGFHFSDITLSQRHQLCLRIATYLIMYLFILFHIYMFYCKDTLLSKNHMQIYALCMLNFITSFDLRKGWAPVNCWTFSQNPPQS